MKFRILCVDTYFTKKQNVKELRIRDGLQQKETIGRTAQIKQNTIYNLVLENACKAANDVISGEAHFRLPDKEWDAFCNALDSKPRDIHALRKLLVEPGRGTKDRLSTLFLISSLSFTCVILESVFVNLAAIERVGKRTLYFIYFFLLFTL